MGILPSHASVNDAITRLQRERDLALRRIDELHDHHKKELKRKEDDDRKMSQWHKEQYQNQLRTATDATAQCKLQLDRARSLIETQRLSIELLQKELGEEAEFDAEETAQMRSVRREWEKRVNQYEDRMVQLQSDMQREIDQQAALLKSAMMRAMRPTTHNEAQLPC
jgi:vacuolar-type H+-ATPase subunit I/STV1